MAAHRKPRRPRGGQVVRTAAGLALAGAASTALFEGTGQAEPGPTADRIKARVDKLYQEAEVATERYNGARERAAEARRSLDALRDESVRRTERLNASRDALGSVATAQYRDGGIDPGVRLALTSGPDQYLERAAIEERVGARQAATVAGVRRQLMELGRLRAQAGERAAELRDRQAELAGHKAKVREKLAAAERLLARLTARQRAEYDGGGSADTHARAARSDAARGPLRAPNHRAAQAVAYAYGALGKPYVWGATGPGSYDCSGLTQAAWRSAGVSLPRTTYTQIDAGTRVARSQLAPGDLVFFYSGVSHVGLYIGGGQMIHAPRPGAPVRVAPIDQMPFAGAARPV